MFRRVTMICIFLVASVALASAAAAGERSRGLAAGDPNGTTQLKEFFASDAQVGDGIVVDLSDLIRKEPASARPPTGARSGLPRVGVRVVGKGKLVTDPPTTDAGPDEGPGDPAPAEPDVASTPSDDVILRAFEVKSRKEYEITLPHALLDAIHADREAMGLTSASEGVVDSRTNEAQRPVPFWDGDGGESFGDRDDPSARSGGVDSRVVLNKPSTVFPWRTIGCFQYGDNECRCTGTLIGPRHMITAGHCINTAGTSNWSSPTIIPAADGPGNAPYGSSTIKPNPDPGTEAWYFTFASWRNPATTGSQWDVGLIVIPNRLGDQTGWMGYVARPASDLNPETHFNRGYPLCATTRPDVPVACQPMKMYGDNASCVLGGYTAMGGNGWNRLIHHTCDTSAGHSGSPVYHYLFDPKLGKVVPVVAMEHFRSECDGSAASACTTADLQPSVARRIEPDLLKVISWLREVFP